jgi:hypothetical protein
VTVTKERMRRYDRLKHPKSLRSKPSGFEPLMTM